MGEQKTLFNGEYTKDPEWKQHWQGMPEYNQCDKEAIKQVVVNFETELDIIDFNKATGLKVTMETRGVFYPRRKRRTLAYVCD